MWRPFLAKHKKHVIGTGAIHGLNFESESHPIRENAVLVLEISVNLLGPRKRLKWWRSYYREYEYFNKYTVHVRVHGSMVSMKQKKSLTKNEAKNACEKCTPNTNNSRSLWSKYWIIKRSTNLSAMINWCLAMMMENCTHLQPNWQLSQFSR